MNWPLNFGEMCAPVPHAWLSSHDIGKVRTSDVEEIPLFVLICDVSIELDLVAKTTSRLVEDKCE